MLMSQVLNLDSALKVDRLRKAFRKASCAISSASVSFFIKDKAIKYTLRSWGWISSW
jgi:hypothetical protein